MKTNRLKASVTTTTLNQWRRLGKWMVAVVASSLLAMAATMQAQSLAYSNAVVSLNPAGYWPMHEVGAAAPGDIETNYGTLGVVGDAYYPDWQTNNGAFIRQWPGPLANGADKAVFFTNPNSDDGGSTNSLFVPHTSPLTTLQEPFTIEMWFMFTNYNWSNTNFQNDIIGQCNSAKNQGFRIFYQHAHSTNVTAVGFNILFYNTNKPNQGFSVSVNDFTTNAWHYLVYTVDSSGNVSGYLDGALADGAGGNPRTIGSGRFDPDFHDPLTIGNGMGNLRGINGPLSEVAIYTNVLSTTEIANHWSIATNVASGPNAYFDAVTNDQPILYYRMDSSPYTAPASNTWPVVSNYGSAGGNGVYSPGTAPGAVAGTAYGGFPLGLIGRNVAPLSGVSSYVDVGNAAAYNPTGTTPFTVSAVFRGNPTDTNRTQMIVGHGTNSWELGMTQNGFLVFNSGVNSGEVVATGSGTGDLVSTTAEYDDGNWHQVMAVHDGTTNILYVDGVADNTNVVVADNVGNSLDMLIGSDPDYTYNPMGWAYCAPPLGVGAQFAGQICDVAFFTNALTLAQVQTLYNAVGVPLYDLSQPVLSRVGSSDVFSVTVKGSSPAYQWYFNTVSSYGGATALTDGGGVSGSTTANLTIANLSDYYFVVANNDYNAVTSSIVQVPQVNVVAAGEPIWNQAVQTNVVVAFSGALDPATATLTGNYALDNGASVLSATLAASNEVVLATSALDTNTAYTLTVQNVENNFGAVMSPSPTNLAVGVYPANIALWIRADSGVRTNADGTVYQWNDLSGNGNNLYTISGIEPQLTTNANGNQAVRFEGTNATEMDAYSSSSLAITGDMSVIAVMSFDTLAGNTNGDIVSKTGVTHANVAAPYDCNVAGNGSARLYRGNGNGTANGTDFGVYSGAANSVTVGAPQILAVSEMGNTVSHFVDGKPVGTGLLSNGYQEADDADLGQDLSIGMRTDQHNRLSGTISELIVAGSPISSYDVGAISGYLGAKYSISVFNPNPTNIVFSTSVVSGTNELTLSWPVDHTGWTLQAQTNSVGMGLSTNWVNVPNSSTTNQMVMPINPTNGSVFYRLIYSGQ